ncbi:unnamed protein product [Larinioides sclopetarius]|uniref:lysozyme n=1 Tax=Larinioides sclopetarius TaxID=280406 RepID=A0AAV2AZF6_9ARAC
MLCSHYNWLFHLEIFTKDKSAITLSVITDLSPPKATESLCRNMSPLRGLLVALLFAQATVSYSKILNQCEVADVMFKLGQKKAIVSKWVCLAKFASGFNTQALSPAYKDGSYDFGIFQINDKYCRLGSTNSCGVPCTGQPLVTTAKPSIHPASS